MNWVFFIQCVIASFYLEVVWSYSDAARKDQVTTLPHSPSTFDFNFFSGYIKVSGRQNFHYMYAESQNDPANDPIIYFTSGGPLCSGLVAFFTEMGPWRPVRSTSPNASINVTLDLNPFSWNKMANILFVEQPVGVGFSYSSNGENEELGDRFTALDSFRVLMLFMERFPERTLNHLYLASEAYGGHIVPLLAEIILTSENVPLVQRFKGIMVGNPFVSFGTGVVARAHALWGYQLIPQRKWKAFVSGECSAMDSAEGLYSPECWDMLVGLFASSGPHLDYDGELFPTCVELFAGDTSSSRAGSPSRATAHLHRLLHLVIHSDRASTISDQYGAKTGAGPRWAEGVDTGVETDDDLKYEPCIEQYLSDYLNRDDVRSALHVDEAIHPTGAVWTECNYSLLHQYPRDDIYDNVIASFAKIRAIESSLRILIYSGDNDLLCPTIGTQHWLFNSLHLQARSLWRPWMKNGQTAGYITQFQGNTSLVTIHRAGHMAPRYEPGRSFEILKGFLSNSFFEDPEETNILRVKYLLQLKLHHEQIVDLGGYSFLAYALRRLFAVDIPESLMGHSGVDAWDIDITMMPDDFEWNDDDTDSSSDKVEQKVGVEGVEVGQDRILSSRKDIKQFIATVAVQVTDAEHGLSLKNSMDVTFMVALKTERLRAYVHRAFYSQVSTTDRSSTVMPSSYYGIVKLRGGDISTGYNMDIVPLSSRADYNKSVYYNISWADADWDDDFVNPSTSETKVPWYNWVLDPVDIVIVVFVPTGIIFIVLLVFVTYRQYHDKIIGEWGYELHFADEELLGNSSGAAPRQSQSGEVEMPATRNPLSSY